MLEPASPVERNRSSDRGRCRRGNRPV